ncbi:heavy-metal-associated domain-containing protein [Streptomyces sp. 6N223]|uniref:heavy-metal-associated domain-containing protein n=1 Tax=Streptomyces sp. 6N223 TaxID=3457412 RepID=UPI003FD075A9
MVEKRYTVTGMSCGHRAASITEQVSQVPGVTQVAVDLAASTVTISGTHPNDPSVRTAIAEVGYGLTDPTAT